MLIHSKGIVWAHGRDNKSWGIVGAKTVGTQLRHRGDLGHPMDGNSGTVRSQLGHSIVKSA